MNSNRTQAPTETLQIDSYLPHYFILRLFLRFTPLHCREYFLENLSHFVCVYKYCGGHTHTHTHVWQGQTEQLRGIIKKISVEWHKDTEQRKDQTQTRSKTTGEKTEETRKPKECLSVASSGPKEMTADRSQADIGLKEFIYFSKVQRENPRER